MTALTPQEKERQRNARARAGRIRLGIKDYINTLGWIAQARAENDHITLGYDSWQAYVDGEYGEARIQLPADMRRKAVEELRLAGASQREIGHTIGVSQTQVRRDLGEPKGSPEDHEDIDRPARSPLVAAMTGAIEEAQGRANGHREPAPGEADDVSPSAADAGLSGPAAAPAGEVGRSSQGQVPTSPAQDHRDERPGDAPDLTPANVGPGRTDVESPSVDPGPDAPPVAGPGSPNLCPLCGQPRDAYRPTQ